MTLTTANLDTHEVTNQPPALENYNLFETDPVLKSGIERYDGGWGLPELASLGQHIGTSEFLHLGNLANRFPPELHTHDRFGHRIDRVEFHPSYHELMKTGVEAGVCAGPWRDPKPGAQVVRAAKHFLLTQVEAGVECPMTMTYAAVPALRAEPSVAAEWEPRILAGRYDPRFLPADQKDGVMIGMAMTEKQGGSDVRANTTRAVPAEGGFHLTGHKWFCSAPMCDAFLTLAYTDRGLTCFLVPRFKPDGSQNRLMVMRLKNKLGNKANASSEIEYDHTWAARVGEEGRGVPTIIEMVNHTRLDCVIGSAGLMRQALAQAIHHTRHRKAFGALLSEQPLMMNVLADLAVESEVSTRLALWLARGYDDVHGSAGRRALVRIATAVSKYWVCKRAPRMIVECLESHGGAGYVEESILPRLYREAPLSSIWEGSGNVMCLDVLRAISKEPESMPALLGELAEAQGQDPRYDAHLASLKAQVRDGENLQYRARYLVEGLAIALQASLLLREGPSLMADAYLGSRLGSGREYGTLPTNIDCQAILERAFPG